MAEACRPDPPSPMGVNFVFSLITHSHQNLSCIKTGVDCPRFIGNDTAEELFTPLLRQLNFLCKCGIIIKQT